MKGLIFDLTLAIRKIWSSIDWRAIILSYDETALVIARSLVAKYGREGALEHSRAFERNEVGASRAHWRQVSSAIWDITTPFVAYHL